MEAYRKQSGSGDNMVTPIIVNVGNCRNLVNETIEIEGGWSTYLICATPFFHELLKDQGNARAVCAAGRDARRDKVYATLEPDNPSRI